MTLQLKAKHFYLIISLIKDKPVGQYLTTMSNLKAALTEDTDLEALISIECPVENLTEVYQLLSQKPEGLLTTLNDEMRELLLPQITAGVGAGNAEWVKVNAFITAVRALYVSDLEEMVTSGKQTFFPG
jgi:hypothetical protein